VAYDSSIYVEKAISEVWHTLALAFGLVVFIIFVFLRNVRSTVIPAVAIPVSIVGSFAVLYALGYSVNILTMLALVLSMLVLAGGVLTFLRVPVWRDTRSMITSELEDSPRSFAGPAHMVIMYLTGHQPVKALEAYRAAAAIYDVTLPWLQIQGAEAAWETDSAALADSLLDRVDKVCKCDGFYRYEASVARARGYPTAADSFAARGGKAPDLVR